MTKWKRADKELPPIYHIGDTGYIISDDLLICCYGFIYYGYYNFKKEKWFLGYCNIDATEMFKDNIVYWRTLPSPPKDSWKSITKSCANKPKNTYKKKSDEE